MPSIEQQALGVSDDTLERHARLARRNRDFRAHALADERLLARAGFPAMRAAAERFTFPIQPWPTFIERRKLASWEGRTIALEKLLKDVPRRLFENDPERLAAYYALPSPEVAELIVSPPNGIPEALSRLDFIERDGELKLLEINTGSYLGGWALTTLAADYRAEPLLAGFLTPDATLRSTPHAMFRHILRCLRDSPLAAGAERLDVGNMYTVGGLEDTLHRITGATLERMANEAAAELGIGVPVHFNGFDHRDVVFPDGCPWADGVRQHAIVEQQDDMTSKELFRAMKTGQLHLYTGPATALIGDKRNIALLYELRDAGVFSAEESELIARTVPWSHVVQPNEVEWEDDWHYLPELLLAERQRLVLKPALASSGIEVYLGRATSAERWRQVVETAVEHRGRWVVQELLVPPLDLYQIGDTGCVPCEMVWGLYALGGEPGGGYLRLSPTGGGPLNVGQGAEVGLFFAVDEDDADADAAGPAASAEGWH